MIRKNRCSRILVASRTRIPSVELGAMIPLSRLQEEGLCEVHYKDEMLLSLSDIAWCDVLFIIRGASTLSLWAAENARKLQRKVLGYWDDDLLGIPNYSLSHSYYSKPQIKANISGLFKTTDFFFSPSHKLAAKLFSLHKNEVIILPVAFGPEKLKIPRRRNHAVSIVGYAGGSDHSKLLNDFLGPVLNKVDGNDVNFDIHIVGPRPKFTKKIAERTKYSAPIRNYYDYIVFASRLQWDIGLAPQVDNDFTTYKFYNKFLEYTSIGCAAIYSKLEPYTGVIQDGITGLLVDNEVDAWKDAIVRLLKNPELRFKMLRNAFDLMMASHTRDVVAKKYATALEPFLSYRAPEIKKTFVFLNAVPSLLTRIYKLSVEYLRLYGVFAFVKLMLLYLLRLVLEKFSKVKSSS